MLSLATDFQDYRVFAPNSRHEQTLGVVLTQVTAGATALKTLRDK